MFYQQGDVLLEIIESLPNGLKKVIRKQKGYILAEGEATGHHHRIEDDVVLFEDEQGNLFLKTGNKVDVIHEEHDTITIDPGIYKVGIVREYDHFLEESRKVID